MKRKIVSIVLAATTAFSLVACGSASAAPAASSEAASAASSEAASAEAATTAAPASEASTLQAVDTANEGEDTLSVYAWDANFNIPALKDAEADYQKNVDANFKLNIIQASQSSDVETAITTAASA